MALAFMSSCVFGYVIDSHKNVAEEAFVAINTRNFLTFGFTYFVVNWFLADGVLVVFSVLGGLFLFVCISTVPLWVFGKRARAWIAHKHFLTEFMVDLE